DNIRYLREKGYLFAEPQEGYLACGWTGKGRLMEPEDLLAYIEDFFRKKEAVQDLQGVRLLVTAGTNVEPLDPVRLMTNRATGKMGYALAEAAVARGARVTLVTGPSQLKPPAGVEKVLAVETAVEMHDAVMSHLAEQDVIIGAAAVSDYRPKERYEQKLKKQEGPLLVEFVRNPDILFEVGQRKRPEQVVVGFAAETEDVIANARGKLERKKADFFVANDVSRTDAGFGVDTNVVTLVDHQGEEALPLMSKREVADRILDRVCSVREERSRS
ncbi:MAG: bifunctional phosphopantothenoylcysteine decarboxylase/phosphopantothenate--cysteine ligase CoaBC, partial [Tumebacillaceae bacterium]